MRANEDFEENLARLDTAIERHFKKGVSFNDLSWPTPALNVLDCVLSLNRRYDGFCRPRVHEFSRQNPKVQSLKQLSDLMDSHRSPFHFGISRLRLRYADRMRIVMEVNSYLRRVQSKYAGPSEIARLRAWAVAAKPEDSKDVGIRGFGLSGFQYLRMLFGAQTVKPDVHIIRFVEKAIGKKVSNWKALKLLEGTGKTRNWNVRDLDFAIWRKSAVRCRPRIYGSDDSVANSIISHQISSQLGGGFCGYSTIGQLRSSKLAQVPNEPGVYAVVKPIAFETEFLPASRAGRFKGRDPSVSIGKLRMKWVDGACVLYIGKAGGTGFDATLQSRIRCYLKYGAGKAVGHEGGRYIWQLRRSEDLVVVWRIGEGREPDEIESGLIQRFEGIYGAIPFANLRR